MSKQMRHTCADRAVPFSRYDLRNAEERIAEVCACIQREHSKLLRLQLDSAEATDTHQKLTALSRTLEYFQDHRHRIEELLTRHELPSQMKLSGCGPSLRSLGVRRHRGSVIVGAD
jgi:hypothetical protein